MLRPGFCGRSQRGFRRGRLFAALEEFAHQHVEHGHEEHRQQRANQHAPQHRGADGALAGRAGARGQIQRHHAQNEGERGHQNGAETQVRGLQRGLQRGFALLLHVFGKFDDQDGVLRGQADHGDQADLKVDVIEVSGHGVEPVAARCAQHHAQKAQRHHQNDGQRNRPAFIQRRQRQKHGQDGEGVEDDGLRAALDFFARLLRPFQAVAAAHFIDHALHFGHGLARGVAAGGRAYDLHGRVAVEALALLHAFFP